MEDRDDGTASRTAAYAPVCGQVLDDAQATPVLPEGLAGGIGRGDRDAGRRGLWRVALVCDGEPLPRAYVAIRDSKDPLGPAHIVSRAAYRDLIERIKRRELDL